MPPEYTTVPLTVLGLTEDDIQTLKNEYPDYENVFTNPAQDTNYGLPIDLIKTGYDTSNVNTDLLLQIFKHEDIRPTPLFNYCADVFKLASKQSPEQQKQHIINAEHYATNTPKPEIRTQLEQLIEQIDNASPFDILHINYRRQANELQERLEYENTPNPQDVWEINLVNIHGIEEQPHDDEPITIVVEDFIIPDEYESESFFESPVLARIVGEYEHYSGLEEGDLFVATPAAFADGKYITNLNEN